MRSAHPRACVSGQSPGEGPVTRSLSESSRGPHGQKPLLRAASEPQAQPQQPPPALSTPAIWARDSPSRGLTPRPTSGWSLSRLGPGRAAAVLLAVPRNRTEAERWDFPAGRRKLAERREKAVRKHPVSAGNGWEEGGCRIYRPFQLLPSPNVDSAVREGKATRRWKQGRLEPGSPADRDLTATSLSPRGWAVQASPPAPPPGEGAGRAPTLRAPAQGLGPRLLWGYRAAAGLQRKDRPGGPSVEGDGPKEQRTVTPITSCGGTMQQKL